MPITPDSEDRKLAFIKTHKEQVERGVKIHEGIIRDESPEGRERMGMRAAFSYYLLEKYLDDLRQIAKIAPPKPCSKCGQLIN